MRPGLDENTIRCVEYLPVASGRAGTDRSRPTAAERRIKAARFPVLKTLEPFDFKARRSINEPLVRELMAGQYLIERESIPLVGNRGTGKTHLVPALSLAACAQGHKVRFFTVTGRVTCHRTAGPVHGSNPTASP